ncbi:MAG TPA: pyridoxamine 5'-phosphate oxidase family protein [Blastocatellia bacterium]|nr:pyridoxamine 5'-phosphate oxidase family protein [Blastocatellia bacterium]
MKRLSKTLREFCEKQDLLRLAYNGRNGYPCVVPLWFVKVGGKYCIGTGRSSAKWRAINRNSRVGWLIDGGKPPKYKGVSQRGNALEITNRRLRASVYRALSIKYFRRADHPSFVAMYGPVDDPGTVYFTLEPEDGFSWEY